MSEPTRVAAGTPVGRLLRAQKINYVLEGAELAHRQTTGPPPPTPRGGRGGTILVRNDTGQDLDRYSVLGLRDPIFDPTESPEAEAEFKAHLTFAGELPDADLDGPGRIVITQAPCSVDGFVVCVISGLTVAYITKDEDTDYTAADLITGDAAQLLAVDGGGISVLWHAEGTGKQLAVLNLAPGERCAYYWEFEISGGKPSAGAQVWSVTIDDDMQDVTVDFDMTAAELKAEILSEFSGVAIDDVEVTGGPLPEVPLTVEWKSAVLADVAAAWPPTVGANSLNNSAWMKVRQLNPRGG